MRTDLIYVRSKFYLCLVVEQPEEPLMTHHGILGVDLGLVQLASTSDGVSYSEEDVDAVREHYTWVKADLQRVGSKSSKRKLGASRVGRRGSSGSRTTSSVRSW